MISFNLLPTWGRAARFWFAGPAALLLLAGPAPAASFSLNPVADAFVATGTNGNFRALNFGTAGALGLAAPNLALGEFQTAIRFDLAAARSAFDAQYGAGQWTVQSATLQLTATPHNNPIFNDTAAGQFKVSWMQNDAWAEGSGTGGTPATDGLSFDSLQGVFANPATDQALGTFAFAGGTSGAGVYSLDLTSGVINDLQNGSPLSLRLYAADDVVSYLFASRQISAPPSRPVLTFTVVPEPTSGALLAVAGGLALAGRYAGRRQSRVR